MVIESVLADAALTPPISSGALAADLAADPADILDVAATLDVEFRRVVAGLRRAPAAPAPHILDALTSLRPRPLAHDAGREMRVPKDAGFAPALEWCSTRCGRREVACLCATPNALVAASRVDPTTGDHDTQTHEPTGRPEACARWRTMTMRHAPLRRLRTAAAAVAGLLLAFPLVAHGGDYQPPRGPTVDERIERLEREIQELKRERTAPAAANAAVSKEDVDNAIDTALKKQKVLAGWQDGFFLQSPNGDFKLKLRGYAQADYRFFPFDDGRTGNDSFFLRRVRPIFEGTVYKYFDFRIMPDFGGGQTVLQDAYADIRYLPYASVRAGKFKEPVSLERLQSGAELTFIERSIFDNLVPNRDVGVMLYGDVADSTFQYQLGAFDGVANGAQSSDGDNQTDKDFAGRVFVQPFRTIDVAPLKHFGFGVAGTYGQRTGEPESSLTFKTAGRSNFYQYISAANVTGKGEQWRFNPQAYYYYGPLGAMGEYGRTESHIKGTLGAAPNPVTHPDADERTRGWFIQASYVLTGEDASYKQVVPIDNFDARNGRWGAFEIAARVSNVDVNDGALKAKLARGSDNTWAYTGGLNWYLTKDVKVQFNYERTNFSRGVSFASSAFGNAGSRTQKHEDVLLTRVQISF